MLNPFAVRAQTTEIVASGLWNVVTYYPYCNYTELATVNFAYANGAYSGTTYTSNRRGFDSSGKCQNAGPQSCAAAGFYQSGQDLLSASQFQAMVVAMSVSCGDKGPNIQSVSFTSPDSVAVTIIDPEPFGSFSFQMTRAAQAAIPASERQVLLDLYNSTNGASWTTKTNWNGAVGTECTWYGVLCDGAQSHVIGIRLNQNNLVGTLPSISGLTALREFWVSNNQLTGSIPSLSGLTSLQVFAARINQLTGTIPSLSGLTALQYFYVRNNQLTGSIPSLSGLTALIDVGFGNNQLTGSIPSLSGLTALQWFGAQNNQLTGSIPSLSELTALQWFGVQNNQLTGPVPSAPTSLLPGQSNLCGNSLVSSGNPTIDTAWVTAQSTDVTNDGVAGGNWLACQAGGALTVTPSGTGYGNVSSSPAGISCYIPEPGTYYLVAPDCTESYADGTSVTLTATPSDGSYFFGWGGACIGTGSCVVTMNAAKNVTATFKPVPFVATTVSTITPTSATISTTIAFNAPDVGKTGAVYITAWVPVNGLGALGILAASMSQAMSVTTTRDNPYLGGKINTRQETLGSVLAAADPNTFVLTQKTSPSTWGLVENGQLTPYVIGVLGDSMSSQNIIDNANPANLPGAQFCVGYGTSAAEMIEAGRMMPVAAIDSGSTATTASGSCNVAAGITAIEFYKSDIDHYFMTASTDEATVLDNKPEWNWARTGKTFNIWLSQSAAPSNASPVCRFFGVFANGTVGSHFYTVDATECAYVKSRLDWGWGYENDAFYAVKPTGGTCPSGTVPIYRAYNNGMGGAPNHRYMATQAEVDTMVAQGWVSEGAALCGVQ